MPTPLTPTDLEDYLRRLHIPGEIVRLNVPTPTVETAARAVGVGPEQIVKSILFLVDGQPVLVIAGGAARIDRRRLAPLYGVSNKKVRLASPVEVLELCGYEVGAMPPFGHLRPLPTLIDRRLVPPEGGAAPDAVVYAGGGAENVLLRLHPQVLLSASGARILDIQEDGN